MKSPETASSFLSRLSPDHVEPGQFNVYRIENFCSTTPLPYNRRDFYKISLVLKGEGFLYYADKTHHIKDNLLAFFNPMVPYSWEPLSQHDLSYSCLFTEEFINPHLKADSLSKSALFKVGANPVLSPNPAAIVLLTNIFKRMIVELQSSYVHKYDLLRSYVQVIMHEALKIEPSNDQTPGSSADRISTLFLELLERQFPISSPRHLIQYRNAGEFARQLAIHTNHLNKAVKQTTGKTTTEHITGRVAREAQALLLHSNWDIAEIGYCLGFGHASNFNIFFKRQTGQSPHKFRRHPISIS